MWWCPATARGCHKARHVRQCRIHQRDGACQMRQLQEQFPRRSGHRVLVLGFVPRMGPGHRLQAGQSAMTGQGRGAGEERHGPGRLW